jgi:hypothetical protein
MVPPTMTLAIPPSSIQIALLVGAPVKNREKSDPKELDAFMPKIIRTIPRANSAIPSGFILCLVYLMFVIECFCLKPRRAICLIRAACSNSRLVANLRVRLIFLFARNNYLPSILAIMKIRIAPPRPPPASR